MIMTLKKVAREINIGCLWLQTLNLSNTGLTAELPALWGVNGSLASLTTLDVSRNIISGGHKVVSWNLAIIWILPAKGSNSLPGHCLRTITTE